MLQFPFRRFFLRLHVVWQRQNWIEKVAVVFFAIVSISWIRLTAGQPFTDWDAIISWDKWGCDIASRSQLGAYCMGGYPPFIPILYSIFYKLSGTYLQGAPDEQLLLHGLLVIFPVMLIMGLARFCRWIGAFWPLGVLLFFCHFDVCQYIANGYVDIPATAISIVATICVLTVYRRQPPRTRLANFIIGIVLGLVLALPPFVKANGILWAAALLLYLAIARFKHHRASKHLFFFVLGLACMLAIPLFFFLHQHWLSANFNTIAENHPHLLAFRMHVAQPEYFTISWNDWLKHIDKFVTRFQGVLFTTPWQSAIGILHLALLVAAWRRPAVRFWAALCMLLITVWFFTRSYDFRNLFPAVALLAAWAAAGLPDAGTTRRARLTRDLLGILLIVAFGGRYLQYYADGASRILSCKPLNNRLVWTLPTRKRLAAYDPEAALTRTVVEAFAGTGNRGMIYTGTPLYRHLGVRGAYETRSYRDGKLPVQPGDMHIGKTRRRGFSPLGILNLKTPLHIAMHQPGFMPTPFSLGANVTNAAGEVTRQITLPLLSMPLQQPVIAIECRLANPVDGTLALKPLPDDANAFKHLSLLGSVQIDNQTVRTLAWIRNFQEERESPPAFVLTALHLDQTNRIEHISLLFMHASPIPPDASPEVHE